ncbi:uncharacterized protein LOC128546436 [Mercenaria mercenaria]|uniref:uncharacterized protein LOC128546436 n=1 Tax=Mercenaria mercenaria TaxID=6596 RepID=UPI00234E6006|nr:uncharacterized protein LOC128546436 [Mercenaria mercenaria]
MPSVKELYPDTIGRPGAESSSVDRLGKNKQKYKKKHSIFTPPSGRDSTLDFYIDAITHELLQKNSKYRFRPNLSTDELSALKNLRNDDSIILKKSDKGSVIVVMNRTDYIAEVNRQLNNTAYYKKLDHNPVEQFSKDVTDVLDVICRNVNGDSNDTLVVPSDARTPQFYILPKIHKDINSELPLGYPGRPIVSGYNSFTEGISEYIDNILKPHMEALPSYVKDSTDFIKKLGSMPNISPNAFLVTMDVSSLYTNIPHDDGIEACRTAMGTRMAPTYASLFMGKLESDFLANTTVKPSLWLRFLDDIFFNMGTQ